MSELKEVVVTVKLLVRDEGRVGEWLVDEIEKNLIHAGEMILNYEEEDYTDKA
jgi:hypothetical protein